MKKRLPLAALALCAAPIALGQEARQPEQRRSSTTGTIVYHRGVRSAHLGNARDLAVYLPPGYEAQRNRRYPVLYLGDGQNVFDGMTSFLPNKEWRIDEAAQALIESNLIEPLIIVGVYNAGADRNDEYLPTRAKLRDGRELGGRAHLYGRMLVEEVKPLIDRTYRTKPDPDNTGLGGSSFGGIVSLYLGLTYPNVFRKLAIVSPSVWWDDRDALRRVDALRRRLPLRIWLDMGTEEGEDADDDALLLRAALERKGWKLGKDLAWYLDRGARHNEDAWAGRSDAILLYLFGKR